MKPIDLLPGLAPTRSAVKTEKGWTVTVTPPPWSGFSGSSIELTEDQFERYKSWINDGGLIQNVFPELSATQREVLLSGIGDEDFQTMADDEEEWDAELQEQAARHEEELRELGWNDESD
jgi:hypothetical protein